MLREAKRLTESCEHSCPEGADIPFDSRDRYIIFQMD
jgi:hypothetical protein